MSPADPATIPRPTIVQLGKYYAPDVGGIETLTRDLATGFHRAGWRSEVVVFSASVEPGAGQGTGEGPHLTRCPIAFHVDSQPVGLRWVAHAAAALRRADLVMLHAPKPLGALVATLVRRAPLILFWHSDLLNKRWLGRLVAPPARQRLCPAGGLLRPGKVEVAGVQHLAKAALARGRQRRSWRPG